MKVNNKFFNGSEIKKSSIKGTQVWVSTASSMNTTIMTVPIGNLLLDKKPDGQAKYAIIAFGVGGQTDGIEITRFITLEELVNHLNSYKYVEADGTIYIKNILEGDD